MSSAQIIYLAPSTSDIIAVITEMVASRRGVSQPTACAECVSYQQDRKTPKSVLIMLLQHQIVNCANIITCIVQ